MNNDEDRCEEWLRNINHTAKTINISVKTAPYTAKSTLNDAPR
jgi:hypothetical protein